MLRRLSLTLLLPFLALSPVPAAQDGWIDLFGEKPFAAWKGKTDQWQQAGSVALDKENPRRLVFETGKGILVNGDKGRADNLLSKQSFGDIELHLEFLIPKGSNSGVKFHGHYEIQISDSFGKTKKLTGDDCGGIYPRAESKPRYHHIDEGIAPRVNACKAPGQWQTLDVIFLVPRFDENGKKIANARILKAILNDQVIHDNQEVPTPTGDRWKNKEFTTGPLFLQGDHGPVAFRNFRVRPYVKRN